MIGQSLVHRGSRKVISTPLPRGPASDTVRPFWSVSEKAGAGRLRLVLLPEMARARIGSAVRFTAAAAIGAAPSRITASAPAAATDRTPGRLASAVLAGAFASCAAGVRARYPAENSTMRGIRLFGSVPALATKPGACTRTQS